VAKYDNHKLSLDSTHYIQASKHKWEVEVLPHYYFNSKRTYLFVTWNLSINGMAPASSAGIAVERVAGVLWEKTINNTKS